MLLNYTYNLNLQTTELKLIHSKYNNEGLLHDELCTKTAAGVKLVKRFIGQEQFWLASVMAHNCDAFGA